MTEEYDPVTGLPKVDEATARSHGCKSLVSTVVLMLIFHAIGAGIAALILIFGDKDSYNTRLEAGKAAEMAWPALAVYIFGLCVIWLNVFPVFYKEQIMKGGNFRANQFIYKQAAAEAAGASVVVLYEEGKIGSYNRGNRSIGHFLENCLPILVTLPIGFRFYPVPSAICLIVYALGRVVY